MLIDLRDLAPGTDIRADLAIVGAGAAGIAIARELVGTGLSVALLESGGFDLDAATQGLYEAPARGTILGEDSPYLRDTRLRYFGGTTNHWAGWCLPLDAIDFEERPWVAESGWPFAADTLAPFYRRAARLVEVRPFEGSPAPGALAGDTIEPVFFHYSPPTRFGDRYRTELVESANVSVYLNATVREIEIDEAGRRTRALSVVEPGGASCRVRARRYVLACGAVENARLLLASRSQSPAGVGNGRDLVGRYFSDHPELAVALVHLGLDEASLAPYWKRADPRLGHPTRGLLRLRPALQRRHELLNAGVHIESVPTELESLRTPDIEQLSGAVTAWKAGRAPLDAASASRWVTLVLRTEQAPNPSSRVTLSAQRDALGMPRASLDWQLGHLERRSVRETTVQLARALGRRSLGRVRLLVDPLDDGSGDASWETWHWGKHHLGTTRMHSDPLRGVVDANCRLHELEDFYVAGSSVFPTPGCNPPTLTIVALALRLADHLRSLPA